MNYPVMFEKGKTNRSIKLGELFSGLSLNLAEKDRDLIITGITDDSRKVLPGDLFVAVPGHIMDGRKFISEATSLGAVAVLTSVDSDIHTEIPLYAVKDLRQVMGSIANRFYDNPSSKLKIIGITGTNGKTTCVYMISSIFNNAGQKWGKIGTIGYDLGDRFIGAINTTPGSINLHSYFAQMLENNLHGCAMEVSSHALAQKRCDDIKYDVAVFTNLTQDHLDYHKTMEEYYQAKRKLFELAPVSVINIDDEFGKRLSAEIDGKVITFSLNQTADLMCEALKTDINGSLLKMTYKGESVELFLPLIGLFNHQNATASAAAALALGLSLQEIADGLSQTEPAPGRLQAIDMDQPFGLYVDYAHTPGALGKLLNSLREFKPDKLHVVFGCGGDRDTGKRPLMGKITSELADYVYLTSDNPRTEDPDIILNDALKGVTDSKKCKVIPDRAMAIKTAITSAKPGDIVVIAGKGHEDYQVVGTVKKYFSDIEVSKSTLRRLGYDGNN